jgi:MATE family multidrug resistance protein
VGAYQLDGLFIGAGYSSAMRDCSILSFLLFILVWFFFLHSYQAGGLWVAFTFYVLIRGITLYVYLPKLYRRCMENAA